ARPRAQRPYPGLLASARQRSPGSARPHLGHTGGPRSRWSKMSVSVTSGQLHQSTLSVHPRPRHQRPETSRESIVKSAPIDPTGAGSWAGLRAHQEMLTPDLRDWFDSDPQRAQRFSHQVADLHVDLSKNLITSETVRLLLGLAEDVGLSERIEAMFTGEHINATEDRAVLHTALRRPPGATPQLQVDGQDVDHDVRTELDKMYAFARKVRSGEWTGVSGKPITAVVNIGIGGSDLGPVMAYEALRPYAHEGIE